MGPDPSVIDAMRASVAAASGSGDTARAAAYQSIIDALTDAPPKVAAPVERQPGDEYDAFLIDVLAEAELRRAR